jgi:alpha-glucoside transport system substrate-binding protein
MRTPTRRRRAVVTTAAVTAMAATLAACGGGSGGGGSEGDGEGDGSVTIWTSMDQPIVDGLEKSLKPKAEEAGIDVKWQRVTGIDKLIMTKLQASDKPDIAVIPQPGVVENMVKRDGALPLDDVLDMGEVEDSLLPGLVEALTFEDQYYGLPINTNVKSVVFYPKKAWEEAGYPTDVASMEELEQLTQQISDEQQGEAWCLGIFSEGSVGWPATDWFEDLVARFGGVEFYNDWVAGEEKFDSGPVRESAEWFESNVVQNAPGNPTAVDFGAADDPMWKPQPGCWMLKQGTFILDFFPNNITNNVDEEVGVFAFPPTEEGSDPPVVGGGDLATMLVDDEDTQQVMQLLAESDIGEKAAETGAYVSPHKDFDASLYPNEVIKTAADAATSAEAFLFDGSDQMPGEVGAGTFWSETTAWVGGNTDMDTMLTNIDESWPAS